MSEDVANISDQTINWHNNLGNQHREVCAKRTANSIWSNSQTSADNFAGLAVFVKNDIFLCRERFEKVVCGSSPSVELQLKILQVVLFLRFCEISCVRLQECSD